MNTLHIECLGNTPNMMCADHQKCQPRTQKKVLIEEVDLGVVSFGTRKENMEQEEKQAKDRSQKLGV